jgi:hypothetical protein
VAVAVVRDASWQELFNSAAAAFSPYSKPAAGETEAADNVHGSQTIDGQGETLVWQPLILTAADGRTPVTFQLPNHPGTYRLSAEAHAAGRLGWTEVIIVCRTKEVPATRAAGLRPGGAPAPR